MCAHCGCTPEVRSISVHERLLADNDRQAAHNRAHLARHGVVAVNLMSAPGAGKTALIEASVARLASRLSVAVLTGDLATDNDARRIRARGVPCEQITTGQACHLDARLVHEGLHRLDLEGIDLLFIENVGNLVCPAGFDLGQHADVALLSVTEGDDKPAKYPTLFRAVDLVLLTKCDLLPYLDDFDPARVRRCLHDLANPACVLEVSSRDGTGLERWFEWLAAHVAANAAGGQPCLR
jgi:hydrogenase nickel incorporation protein HypB